MLRSSSKRALSSTRQTDCLPSSAHWMSEPTSTLSSLVRYTAVFIAMTLGSRTAACAKTSKLAMNEPYGWWTSTSPRRISSKICGRSVCALASRGGIAGIHGSYFNSGRSMRRELQQLGEVERALDAVDLRLVGAEPALKAGDHLGRRRRAHLDPHDVAEAAPAELRSRRPRAGRRRRRRPRSRRRASRGRPRARRCPHRGRATAGSGR